MDSGYSKHMTGRIKDFFLLKTYEEDNVSFGNRNKGYIGGTKEIGNYLIQSINVLHFIDGLKYNLISVAQIYDKGNKEKFTSDKSTVTSLKDCEVMLTTLREKIYILLI